MEEEHRILVVDDSEGIRDLFVEWLEPQHDVETAANGTATLETVDGSFDLVLLDREMPGRNGQKVAELIDEGGYDIHVVMVSSLPADFDIVEYPIDSYVRKPVSESDIQDIIGQYTRQQSYHAALEEYFALSSKLAALEAEFSGEELKSNDRYEKLERRVAEKRAEVDEAIAESTTDWDFAFKSWARAADVEHEA